MRIEPRPHPVQPRKRLPKKWYSCSHCFKRSWAESLGKIRHYRGCPKSREWNREALSGKDILR